MERGIDEAVVLHFPALLGRQIELVAGLDVEGGVPPVELDDRAHVLTVAKHVAHGAVRALLRPS